MEATKELSTLIIYVTVVIVLMVGFLVYFFVVYQRRKTSLLVKQAEERKQFEIILAQTQTEIQEQTLKNISWELHDNVGQLLSVARMHTNMISLTADENTIPKLEELSELIGKSLQDVRTLSKTLNSDALQSLWLVSSLNLELERFNRLRFLEATLRIEGEEITIQGNDSLILFRILQEFFSNVTKHAKASQLEVRLQFLEKKLLIEARDNGVGFDLTHKAEGIGLLNMKNRAKLIGADINFFSNLGQGTRIVIEYPI